MSLQEIERKIEISTNSKDFFDIERDFQNFEKKLESYSIQFSD